MRDWIAIALWALPLAGCQGTKPEGWQPAFQGVEYRKIEQTEPRPIVAHAVRIDLEAEGLEILATLSNGEAPGETSGLRTSSFLKELKCQVAINAAPFAPIHLSEGLPQDVSGLMISNGEVVSPGGKNRPVLAVREGNKVSISRGLKTTEGVRTAVAGFHIVLQDGQVTGKDEPLHPRTAAAVTQDGRHLILLVVDGRQNGYSEGMSTRELGELLKSLGGWDGINLDGGGTSTLVFENKDGGADVINRPINGGIPGLERVSASHLGVRARGLEE